MHIPQKNVYIKCVQYFVYHLQLNKPLKYEILKDPKKSGFIGIGWGAQRLEDTLRLKYECMIRK